MKQVYLILAALMLLCLAPMPYGYFQLVRFVAMVVAVLFLFPQWLTLPSTRESHCSRVNDRIFREQGPDICCEGVRLVNGVEPVGDVAEMRIEFVGSELTICNPSVGKSARKAGIDDNSSIPETSVVCTNVTNYGNTAQPTSHILKLGNHETTTDGFLGCTVVHVAVKFGQCSHRCHLHRFPYWRHRWFIVLPEMFLYILVFRTVQFFLQVSKITSKQIAVFCQCGIHRPESTMPFCKDTYHPGSYSNFYMLNGRKEEHTQLFVETIKTHYLGESGIGLESVLLPVCLHQSPIASQTEVADNIKSILGFFLILYEKTSLFKNVNLLLERKQLFGISHNRTNKKCPALVRYIPCGREAVAGSIGCKVTTFYRNIQMIWQKSA